MQMDSDLVIYRTTLVLTFQVSTRSVFGKWVYLVTLAMSLFDLQDVCIAIGSITTLDLPMVVDLIGIYGLKRPYCTLTTTNWLLQALSVIPMGSWGDVARRSYHDPMGKYGIVIPEPQCTAAPSPSPPTLPPLPAVGRRPPLIGRTCSDQFFEENPSALISSGLLVQADEGVSLPVVDLIDESTAAYREEPQSHKQSKNGEEICQMEELEALNMMKISSRANEKRKSEKLLKSGCKREEKKRALNGLKKQPAPTRPAQCRPD
ncbi:H(\+)-transporting atpase plant/ plasma membrane type [Dorcoceras hygrometricum]|uniref:H(\+)-transporting atpase plant/ plasma membrane type n=1 Tax=Dorcoceras hygrometricum TaxID=472368 RepID=A0A2Z7D1Y9_9LAMI|nr:H(\+)-transporting atpase plant/ plasma membrane type [Dorcoceras hygrometricum]